MSKAEIPKRIHYCWFGGRKKPELVIRCINSWKKKLPTYQIKEWNEDSFDITCNPYVYQAYQNDQFAFVSDYARVHALYYEGGIYLDTDVEVMKTFDDFLTHESFWGFEQGNYIATSTIGAQQGNPLIKTILDGYKEKNFIRKNGSYDQLTNVALVTELFEAIGVRRNGDYQEMKSYGVVYPQSYFSPYDYINCSLHRTENTCCIHHFYKSWLPPKVKIKSQIKKLAASVVGGDNVAKIRKRIINK